MKRYIDNARNFDDLNDKEKVELFVFAAGIPLFLIGSGLLLLTDELLIGAIFVGMGILDLTVMPRFLARNVEVDDDPDAAA